jgi:hypothetical protein
MEIFVQRLDADLGGLGFNDYRITDLGGIGNTDYGASYGPPAIDYDPVADQYLVCWSGTDNVGGLVQNESEIFGQRLQSLGLFVDGFETGDTGSWSVATGT